MSEPLINKVIRFYNEAVAHKSRMESKKFHKLKLIFWTPYQREYYVVLAVIETCQQLLTFKK